MEEKAMKKQKKVILTGTTANLQEELQQKTKKVTL
jgi:hypothetical protein